MMGVKRTAIILWVVISAAYATAVNTSNLTDDTPFAIFNIPSVTKGKRANDKDSPIDPLTKRSTIL